MHRGQERERSPATVMGTIILQHTKHPRCAECWSGSHNISGNRPDICCAELKFQQSRQTMHIINASGKVGTRESDVVRKRDEIV